MSKLVMKRGVLDQIAASSHVEANLKTVADAGRDEAKRIVPVLTGGLRDSIESGSEPGEARYGTNREYADEVELGTRDTEAEPYLLPAMDVASRALS